MTYIAGGSIQATDFNSFVSQINEVFADSNSGSVVAPPADFGYGHPALATVAVGQNVGAAEWTSLFSTIKDIGTHQGTVLDTSGIPALVNAGNIIYAITVLQQVVNDAKASRLSIDASQIAMVPLFTPSQPLYSTPQWTSGIEFVYTVDFGSWNNARHYFNLGGSIGMAGSIPDGGISTANHFWHNALVAMGVVKMDYTSTSSNGITTGTIGFYDLTTSYQEIYRTTPTGYYSGSYISVKAKLNAAPGTNGVVQFNIGLYDADLVPDPKTGPLVWTINSFQSSGVIPYLGTVTAATVGAGGGGSSTPGFNLVAYSGGGGNPLLTLQLAPTSLNANISGAGTANAGPITCTVLNGVPPYSFAWTNVTSSPNTVTITSPVNTLTTSQVSISKALLNAEMFSGTIRCTVTDGAAQSAYLNANWSFTSTPVVTPTGEEEFGSSGTFIVPPNVFSVSVVAIGGGGGGALKTGALPNDNVGGGGGGGLAYKNNIAVTPGQNISVTVGAGGASVVNSGVNIPLNGNDGGTSSFGAFFSATGGLGGQWNNGSTQAGGTGIGGDGNFTGGAGAAGGGGAAGYAGTGGAGGIYIPGISGAGALGQPGSGGAAGGGGGGNSGTEAAAGGGGTGRFGIGSSGGITAGNTNGGNPGSGGSTGGSASSSTGGQGGFPGGGGGMVRSNSTTRTSGQGRNGIVRIIWGPGRSFPNNAS